MKEITVTIEPNSFRLACLVSDALEVAGWIEDEASGFFEDRAWGYSVAIFSKER